MSKLVSCTTPPSLVTAVGAVAQLSRLASSQTMHVQCRVHAYLHVYNDTAVKELRDILSPSGHN